MCRGIHRRIAVVVLATASGILLAQAVLAVQCEWRCVHLQCYRHPNPPDPMYPCGQYTELSCIGGNVYTKQAASGTTCTETPDDYKDAYKCTGCDPECATNPSYAIDCGAYQCVNMGTSKKWLCDSGH